MEEETTIANQIRTYIQGLRTQSGMSQRSLAKEIGLSERAYIDWETGETADIKSAQLLRAMRELGGDFAHLAKIAEVEEQAAVTDTERSARLARLRALSAELDRAEDEELQHAVESLVAGWRMRFRKRRPA